MIFRILLIIIALLFASCGGGGGAAKAPDPASSGSETITLSGQIVDGLDGIVRVEVDGNVASLTGTTWTHVVNLDGGVQTVMVECYLDDVLIAAQDLDITRN